MKLLNRLLNGDAVFVISLIIFKGVGKMSVFNGMGNKGKFICPHCMTLQKHLRGGCIS